MTWCDDLPSKRERERCAKAPPPAIKSMAFSWSFVFWWFYLVLGSWPHTAHRWSLISLSIEVSDLLLVMLLNLTLLGSPENYHVLYRTTSSFFWDRDNHNNIITDRVTADAAGGGHSMDDNPSFYGQRIFGLCSKRRDSNLWIVVRVRWEPAELFEGS